MFPLFVVGEIVKAVVLQFRTVRLPDIKQTAVTFAIHIHASPKSLLRDTPGCRHCYSFWNALATANPFFYL